MIICHRKSQFSGVIGGLNLSVIRPPYLIKLARVQGYHQLQAALSSNMSWCGHLGFSPIQINVTKPRLEGKIVWFLIAQWIVASITVIWYREHDHDDGCMIKVYMMLLISAIHILSGVSWWYTLARENESAQTDLFLFCFDRFFGWKSAVVICRGFMGGFVDGFTWVGEVQSVVV